MHMIEGKKFLNDYFRFERRNVFSSEKRNNYDQLHRSEMITKLTPETICKMQLTML